MPNKTEHGGALTTVVSKGVAAGGGSESVLVVYACAADVGIHPGSFEG